MQPSERAYSLIKSFEGLVLNAYPDPGTGAEPITIGFGTTIYDTGQKVKMGDVITEARAFELLKHEVNKKAIAVSELTNHVNLTQNQFDALVSFAYNIGLGAFQYKSSVYKKLLINANDPTIRDSFLLWNKAGGNVMAGLTRRRKAEADLYFS